MIKIYFFRKGQANPSFETGENPVTIQDDLEKKAANHKKILKILFFTQIF